MKGKYNERGMTGDCRGAARVAAVGIGTAIGGVVGGAVAGAAFEYFEEDIFGPRSMSGMTRSTAFEAAMLEKWFNNKFQPWQKRYFTDLSNLSDQDYKDTINSMLLNLEAIRLMYEAKGTRRSGSGMNAGTDYDIPEVDEIETKAGAFKYLVDMVRDVFLETMEERGKKPGKGIQMKTVKNFKPENFKNLDRPEQISYEGGAKTDVDVYTFSKDEELDLDIDKRNPSNGEDENFPGDKEIKPIYLPDDPGDDSNEDEEDDKGEIDVVPNPDKPVQIYNPDKNKASVDYKAVALTLGAAFGGYWVYKNNK